MDDVVFNPDKWPTWVRVGGIALCVVIFLSVLSFLSRPASLQADLRDLVVHAAQHHEISKQDSDPVLALQHSTTALAFLSICRKLASDSSIQAATKVNPADLERMLRDQQSASISALHPHAEPTLTSLLAGFAKL